MKKVARAVTVESLEEPQVLDEVLNTDGWRNLMAITAESARAFFLSSDRSYHVSC